MTAPVEATPRLPAGHRIYAVGDVHGRLDLLERLRDLVAADLDKAGPAEARIVFLGDYVDRGPDSRGVVECLLGDRFPAPAIHLLGNHEVMLLDFLRRPETGRTWRRFGGIETVQSYGVDLTAHWTWTDLDAAAAALAKAMPAEHVAFLERLPLTWAAGRYFFCHAGVRPGVALAAQTETDLLTIREEFVGSPEEFGAVVVHGHTPAEAPLVRPNAIGLDTGAYITGRLTCAVLHGDAVDFLTT